MSKPQKIEDVVNVRREAAREGGRREEGRKEEMFVFLIYSVHRVRATIN